MFKLSLYWVVLCKGNDPVFVVSGPFGLYDEAEADMDSRDDPSGRCYLKVVESHIEVDQ